MVRRLIDAHVHFWQPQLLRYEWLAELPAINRPYVPEDLARATTAVPLEKIVFVQADCVPADGLREVAWVSELAAAEPRIQAIVAFAPLEQEDCASYLAQLRRYPLVKGVRRLIQGESVDFATRPEFVRGLQAAADFGYTFDICIRHEQLESVVEMVRLCPNVHFVLDHVGKPAIRAGILEPWATHLRQLADFANVCCKLSGLVTEADWQTWTPASLQPYIDHALAVFGPERLMFGGDWPVSEVATDHARWLQTAETAVGHLSEVEQDRIFYTTANTFYRLK